MATPVEDDFVIDPGILVHFFFLPDVCGIFPEQTNPIEVVSHDILGVIFSVPLFSEAIR